MIKWEWRLVIAY